MAFTVRLDKGVCLSSGKCVADAPSVFVFDEDELAEVRTSPDEIPDDRLLAIARNCPSGAIRIFDGDGEVSID